jgi:hypothetical protein
MGDFGLPIWRNDYLKSAIRFLKSEITSAEQIVACERVIKAVRFRLGKDLQDLLGEFEVVAGGDLEIHRGAGDDRDRVAKAFHELRVVGGGVLPAFRIRFNEK